MTCFVLLLFNVSGKFPWRDAVCNLKKASVGALVGCLLIIDPWKIDRSKRVRLMEPLEAVTVFIVFKISMPLLFSLIFLLL